jgi:hypothetical protein
MLSVNAIILMLLTLLTVVNCPDPSFVVNDDRIDGIVLKEGRPRKHAAINLSSLAQDYTATTDNKGAFSMTNVARGKYFLLIKGWGKAQLEVKGRNRVAPNRPVLEFSASRGCLLMISVSN